MGPMGGRVSSAVQRFSSKLRGPWGGARGPHEPPVVRGWVPYLGCALPFGRNAPDFLVRCRQRYGDAFSVHLMGRRLTFLLDARDFPSVLKQSETLSFNPIAHEISTRAFGYRSVYDSPITEDELRAGYHRHLRSGTMGPLAERTQEGLAGSLVARLRDLPPGDQAWREASLYELVARVVFEAGTFALFGEGSFDEPARQHFESFDANFGRLVAGVPLRLLGSTRHDREVLIDRLVSLWPHASAFIEERHEMLAEHVDAREVARVQFSMLWASQANTIPAAFWAVALLLEDEHALAAVRDEIDQHIERRADGRIDCSPDRLKRMRHLDSAILEALRLTSGAITIRAVVEPCTLELTSGQRCALRPGDHVCMFPYITHRDPDVFEQPEQYRFDRFYSERGAKQFFKAGERLGYALMPFGGGETMCPGRFLALSEIKMLVVMLLADYEVERLPQQTRPAFDMTRSGLGILPPAGPLRVRVRPRSRD